MSLREQILAISDATHELVEIPEWTKPDSPVMVIEVRSLSLAIRNRITDEATDKKGKFNVAVYHPRLIVASCHDPETGEPIFTLRDIPALEAKNAAVMDRLAKVAMELPGAVSESDIDKSQLESDDDLQEALTAEAERRVEMAGKAFSSTAISESGSLLPSDSVAP